MQAISGGKWTSDGRWVVIGQMMEGAPITIIFDPGNSEPWLDLQDCLDFVKTFR